MTTTVELRDGGYVDYWIDPSGTSDPDTLHVQKHNADGSLAGPEYLHVTRTDPTILALSDGGYVVGINEGAPGGTILRAEVFAANGGHLTEFTAGKDWSLVASEDGAFAVSSTFTTNHNFTHPDGLITVYANDGSVLAGTGHVYSSSGSPTITVDADGVFHAVWTEGSRSHDLAIDPRSPLDLTSPLIPAIAYVDDNGPELRVTAGGWSNDNTPTIRVPVTEAGYVAVGAFGDPGMPRFEITADDLAHGYKDVPLSSTTLSDGTATFEARVEDADGMVSGVATMQIVIDTEAPGKPAITHVTDDQGLQQGEVANGGTTDDTTPTFQIALGAGTQANDILAVSDNGTNILTYFISAADLQRGYVQTTISRGDGDHSIIAQVRDQAGNASTSDAFAFTTQSQTDHGAGGPKIGDNSGIAGHATLYEKNLPDGTASDSGALTYSGTFAVTSPDGIAQLSIDGHMVVENDEAAFANGPLIFDTGRGETLSITGYDAATHTVSYTYTLDTAIHHQQGGAPPVINDDKPMITVVDHDGDTSRAMLDFGIVDDMPKVVWDTGSTAAGATLTGNVLANDQLGADGAHVANAFSRQSGTSQLDANGEYTVQGDFGVMHIKPDGDWTYQANAGVADGSVDRFQFAVSDADGSSATSSDHLDITIGAASSTDHTPTMQSGGYYGGALQESALPWGTAPDPTRTNVSGTVTLISQDGFAKVTVGGGTVWANGAFAPYNVATPGGETLAVTGFDPTTGVLSFTYKLTAAADHSTVSPGNFYIWDNVAVAATDSDGDTGGGSLTWQIYDDRPQTHPDTDTVAAGGTATGNVITDASSGDVGDGDEGGDAVGADGAKVFFVELDGSASGSGGLGSLTTPYGVLNMNADGSYAFHANADAPAGTVLAFNYRLQDGDHGPVGPEGNPSGRLTITVQGDQGGSGQVINSPGPGSTLEGTAGNDTINASRGPDVISTGAGSDVVAFHDLPWSAGHITDFTVGTDHLDLSAIFQASGYTGSDPVADGRMSFDGDGAGGTRVYFDRDQPNGGDWPFLVTTLDHVSPGGLTWAQLSGGPPPTSGPTVGFATTAIAQDEGNSGVTHFQFTVTRTGDIGSQLSIHWTGYAGGQGQAQADDFANGMIPVGSLTFMPGETSKILDIGVVGDTNPEQDENFRLHIDNQPGLTVTSAWADGTIRNDDSGDTAGTPGQVYTADHPGATVVGGAGDDTINASQGADRLTGGAGNDDFVFRDLPYSSGHITDFVVGSDKLDLSAIFQASGYSGTDPVADGQMRFQDDGHGNAQVYFDHDQLDGGDWPFRIVTLDGVSANGLTWAALSTGGGSSSGGGSTGGGPEEGQVITSDQYGDTLVGGEGNDTLNAGQGPDVMSGNGGADHFVWNALPWRPGAVTDFTPGVDKLDLRPLFQQAGYSGADPIADHHLQFRDDGQGNTQVYFDRDDPNGGDWPFFITTLQGVTPGQIGAGDWLFR